MIPKRLRWALLLTAGLPACSSQFIYSTNPVDSSGEPLPLERATGLLFEDGNRLRLNDGESLELIDGRFHSVHGTWNASQVAAVLWTDYQGRPDKTNVLTPDDLVDLDDPPRITQVQLVSGETFHLDELDAEALFQENGLTLDITGPGLNRSIEVEAIHTLHLHRADILGSTVMSWKFWAVSGAAVAATILITKQTDPESIAVR